MATLDEEVDRGSVMVGESEGNEERTRLKRRMHAYVNAIGELAAENKVLKSRLHRAQERLADLVAKNRELKTKVE